jgi:hypothetical protein
VRPLTTRGGDDEVASPADPGDRERTPCRRLDSRPADWVGSAALTPSITCAWLPQSPSVRETPRAHRPTGSVVVGGPPGSDAMRSPSAGSRRRRGPHPRPKICADGFRSAARGGAAPGWVARSWWPVLGRLTIPLSCGRTSTVGLSSQALERGSCAVLVQ